ncbi:uncharacterized protein LOC132254755 [Vitis vinifera]|uniref:uncharacterized protein LOC132254755 n=1 Tax=Vitis vinifera TaxID=29760 RepID=UPI0028833BC1|nr:uncharacterized protein LOC132254755 [Vitis vinifera]
MTSLLGWCMYFDGVANQLGYGIGVLLVSPQGDHITRSVRLTFPDRHPTTNNIVEYEACIIGLETALELGIRQMEVFGDSNLVFKQIQGDWKTRDVKLRSYHTHLELLVARFDDLRYVHLPRVQNRFVDVLATLASSVDISIDVVVRPLLIELRFAPTYCCLIGEIEVQDDLPWYHDIYQFLRSDTYLEVATTKDRRALRQLATRFVICGDTLYRRSVDGATPSSLVYGMETVLPVKIEMGSLRVALKQQISEIEWAQAQFDQLNLLDEKRLRAADHVQAYQRKMACAFRKWVKPRPL